MPVSKDTIYSLLQGCIHKKDLAGGRHVHSLIISSGLGHVNILSDHLIRLFAFCENLLEANLVFCNIAEPSVFSWEAIISAHVSLGQRDKALTLYHAMQIEGVDPNRCIFLAMLKACGGDGKSVKQGRLIHEEIIRSGVDSDKAVMNSLIDMYAKLGSLDEARKLFDELPNRDVVSFGAMIAGYTLHGHGSLALELFEKLQQQGERPDKVTFLTTLKACSSEAAIQQGRLIHDEIITRGLQSDVVIGSSLLDMYAKCGSLEEARKVFDVLLNRNIVSWSAMIAGYAQHGHGVAALKLYESMLMGGVRPDKVTFLCTLKACGCTGVIDRGRLIHDQIIRNGYISDAVIGSALLDMYANCGGLNEARKVFDSSVGQDVVTWSSLIAAYTQHGHGDVALKLFREMQEGGRRPNNATFASILKACGSIGDIAQGRLIYDQIIRNGLDVDVIVGSTVVDMYSKCGSLREAQRVFDILPNLDVISWGSMIDGYAQHGYGLPALLLFEKLQKKGIKSSNIIFSSVLKACARVGALEQGQLIYDQIVRNNLDLDVVIGNTLVDMYSSCESLEEARKVFDQVLYPDMVSWNAMIAGYARHRYAPSALELFDRMQKKGMNPDKVTFSCVLKACGGIGALTTGRCIHNQILRNELESDVVVGTTLIDMYATCGRLEEARKVFETLPNRNTVSWCVLIAGYAQHDKWRLAADCIHEMQCQGLKPDERIHTIMLTACSHLGEVEEGHWYYKSMKQEHVSMPSIEHLNCMIDLFGRTGQLCEAAELLKTMPSSPDTAGWMSLLTACKKFNNAEVGGHCFNQIIHLDPNLPAAYVFMSNIYADADMSEKAWKVQQMKRFSNSWKRPGKACIEVSNEVHELVVGDRGCTPDSEVLVKVERLRRLMEDGGYMPNLDVVLEPSLKEFNEDPFCGHHGLIQVHNHELEGHGYNYAEYGLKLISSSSALS